MQRFMLIVIALFLSTLLNAQIVSTNSPVIEKTPELTGDAGRGYRHGDSGLLFIPTAYTLPKGMFQASTWAFVIYTLGHGVSDELQVNFSTMLPIKREALEGITGSAKYRLYQQDKLNIASWVTLTPFLKIATTGFVGSLDLNRVRVHGGIGLGFDFNETEIVDAWMFGWDFQMGPKRLLFSEFGFTAKTSFEENRIPWTLGVRFYPGDFAWELAWVGIMDSKNDDAQASWFPMLKATMAFE